MNTLAKSETLGTLGLTPGDHWVKFHVEGDSISFEVAASAPASSSCLTSGNSPRLEKAASTFVQNWSGKGHVLSEAEQADDPRLARLTAKHLR